MAVTPASLKARWTEFAPTDDAVVQGAINEATRLTAAAVFGAAYDDAVTLRACHLLAISPQGQTGRLEGDATSSPSSATQDLARTTYGTSLLGMIRARAGGAYAMGVWS